MAGAEALALRFFLAAVTRAQATPLLAVVLLAYAVWRRHDVALLVTLVGVYQRVVGGGQSAQATAVTAGLDPAR